MPDYDFLIKSLYLFHNENKLFLNLIIGSTLVGFSIGFGFGLGLSVGKIINKTIKKAPPPK